MKAAGLIHRYKGAAFHLLAGILVFVVWRIAGLPAPGTSGRLIPLAWVLLFVVSGNIRIHRLSVLFLTLFVLLSFMWRTGPVVELLVVSFAVLGLFPALLSISGKGRWGLVRASVPLFFLTVLLVPFEGDEPHYAAITENLAGGGSEVFSDPGVQKGDHGVQKGDLGRGESHHTKAFPFLLLPGYPLGVTGVRTVSFLMAIACAALLALLFRKHGFSNDGNLAWLGLVLIPGAGILGLLYPGWVALGLFCVGVMWGMKSRRGLLIIAAVTLALTAVKFRFFALGAGLFLVWLIRLSSPRKIRMIMLILGGVVLALAADYFLLGGSLFWNRYGNTGVVMAVWTNITRKTGSLLLAPVAALLDIEAGLLWKAPWLLLSFAGLPELKRRFPDLFLTLGLPSLLYVAIIFLWMPSEWHSLPTPPGRLFIPLLPIMLASASMVLRKPSARMLLWLSLLVTALCIANPWLRFNHADGTDSIVSALTGGTCQLAAWLPSQLRPALVPFMIWAAFFTMLVALVKKTRSGVLWALLAVSVVAGAVVRTDVTVWEMEDLDAETRMGCVAYPRNIDPHKRNFWLFDRQMMLHLEHPLDRIMLPVPPGDGDSIAVEITLRGYSTEKGVPGIRISCGSSNFITFIDSGMQPPPDWVRLFRRGEEIPRRPENLADTTLSCVLACVGCDMLVVEPLPWSPDPDPLFGIYLDRIEVHRR